MDNDKWSGWANRATWLVNLHFGEIFKDRYDDGEMLNRDDIETFLYDWVDDLLPHSDSFMNDITADFIDQVDLDEIVEHITAD